MLKSILGCLPFPISNKISSGHKPAPNAQEDSHELSLRGATRHVLSAGGDSRRLILQRQTDTTPTSTTEHVPTSSFRTFSNPEEKIQAAFNQILESHGPHADFWKEALAIESAEQFKTHLQQKVRASEDVYMPFPLLSVDKRKASLDVLGDEENIKHLKSLDIEMLVASFMGSAINFSLDEAKRLRQLEADYPDKVSFNHEMMQARSKISREAEDKQKSSTVVAVSQKRT